MVHDKIDIIQITQYTPNHLVLDRSPNIGPLIYLVGNLTNSKIAEAKAFECLKSWHFFISNFQTCKFPNKM